MHMAGIPPAQQLIQFGQLIMQEGYMQQEANPLP